ncbi:MAG: type II secretion system protein GspM [Pseudomonadota bacterium]
MSEFWTGLSVRERWLIGVGGALAILVGGWLGVVRPLADAREDAINTWRRTGDDLTIVEDAAARARAAALDPGARAARQPSRAGLRAAATGAARAAGLGISRLQPEDETAVRVWVDDAPAENVYAWLVAAERDHGLSVREASISSRRGDGNVAVEVTLSIGGA